MNYELENCFGQVIDKKFYPKIKIPSGVMRISLLNVCNYKCPHCFQEGELKNKEQILPLEYLKKVIDFAKEYYGLHTVKFTGGEPLLYPELEPLLSYMKASSISSEFTTNGYFLEDKIQILLDNGVKYITVTLNTINEETYNILHRGPKDSLYRVLNGILKTSEQGIKIRLNLVALDIKNQDIKDVMNFAYNNHLVMRLCEPTCISGVYSTSPKIAFKETYDYIIENSQSCVKSLCESVEYVRMNNGLEITIMHNLCDNRLCASCGKYLYVRLTSDGKLKPCLSRRDTESMIPFDATALEMNQCFLYAVNNMGNGLEITHERGLKL